ncbi:MAG: hypothetical protein OXI16_04345 [Chloroflexota bacterium]|nr:hypothetical protein [Chloroflexota bacterium]
MLFSILYVVQTLPGMAFIVWLELAHTTTDSAIDTVKAIIWGIAVVGGAALATTVSLVEVQELMLGTRDIINDWLQKRNEAAEAKGHAEGHEEGRVEGRAEMREEFLSWVGRRDTARENDEPFDEPPPGSDKPID